MLLMMAMNAVNNDTNLEINLARIKSNPKIVSLMETLRKNKIDIDSLNETDIKELIKCILIISR
jgi:hypothetical protein